MESSSLQLITQIGFVITTIFFFGLVLKHLRNALAKLNTDGTQRTLFRKVVIALLVWMIVLSSLSISGVFSDFSAIPPRFAIIIFVPLISLVWVLLFSKTTKKLLLHIPNRTIIDLQSFRVIVEILLWLLFIQNLLPVRMTFEGTNFDIIAGLTAPVVSYLAYSKNILSRKVVIAWNIICLGLLINIVLTAILSMPTAFQYFMSEPSAKIMTTFPYILLPGFLVPLAYGLHFLSLRQLINQKN